jgi:hypothetical protein
MRIAGSRPRSAAGIAETLIVRLTSYAVAGWIVIEAGAGVRVNGTGVDQQLVALLIAGMCTLLSLPTVGVGHAETRTAVFLFTVAGVAVPGALLLGVPVTHALGLPFELAGGWSLVLATVAIWAVAYQVRRIPQALVDGDLGTEVVLFGCAVLAVGGLWLAQAMLGDVRLSGTIGEQLFTLAVLAALFRIGPSTLHHADGPPGLLRVVVSMLMAPLVCAAKLWALCWVSTWMAATLRIHGFGTFVLVTAIVTVVTMPAWLVEQRRYRETMAEHDALQEQRMAHHMAIQQEMMAHQREWMRHAADLTIMSALSASRAASYRSRSYEPGDVSFPLGRGLPRARSSAHRPPR